MNDLVAEAEAALEGLRRTYNEQNTYPSSPSAQAVANYGASVSHAAGLVAPLLENLKRAIAEIRRLHSIGCTTGPEERKP